MFHEPRRFPFTEPLEHNWRAVYDEYLRVRDELVDWYEGDLHDGGWKVFGLFDFPNGEPVEGNVAKCPLTASLVHAHFGHHGAAGFSVLRPMTRIKPHRGYQGDFLRCHLGLRVPTGDCGVRVTDEVRRWEEGRVLVFDDREVHEAWNLTRADRVILLVDFVPELV